MIVQFLLLFSAFLFSCFSLWGQESRDYYNLSLATTHLSPNGLRWSIKVKDDTMRGQVKRVLDKELNKSVFCIYENQLSDGKRIALDAVLSQQFPIYHAFNKADIRVNIKEENLQEAWMKVYLLGIDEKCIAKDSIPINGHKWQSYRLSVPLKDACYLWLAFSMKGKDCNTPEKAKMLIEGVDIRLDGRSMNQMTQPEKNAMPQLSASHIQPLSLDNDSLIGKIFASKKHLKIIGLGETFHGNQSFYRINNQVIRWLVNNRQCKLIMVEVCSMIVLKWDLYIQGYEIDLNEITEELAGSTVSREETIELLKFLRAYNQKARKKVHITGIDRSAFMLVPLMHDFFYTLYKQKPDTSIYNVLKSNFIPDSVLPLLVKPEYISKSIGMFHYTWFRQLYWLNLMEQHIPGVSKHGTNAYRDYIMWRHAYYALQASELEEDECAVVTAHWMHLNKWNGVYSFYPSLGYYLTESYGENYYSLALLAGKGTFCSYQWEEKQFNSDCPLSPLKESSLEKCAMKSEIPYFYYPADELLQSPTDIRCVPAGDISAQFKALNIPKRMDGFIFIRDSQGIPIPENQKTVEAVKAMLIQRIIRMVKQDEEELNIKFIFGMPGVTQ